MLATEVVAAEDDVDVVAVGVVAAVVVAAVVVAVVADVVVDEVDACSSWSS